MKKYILGIVLMLFFSTVVYASSICGNNAASVKNIIIKNRLFSITIPDTVKGKFETKVTKDRIEIYDKESKKAGFGGFAFGVKAYLNPADHAVLPGSSKIGELVDKRGKLYDMVIKYPTDVQFDYTKGTTPPDSYKFLYDYGSKVNIEGIRGAEFYKNQGMKGEDLYKDVLQKHISAIREKWDSIKLEQENMSCMYNVLRADGKTDVMNKVGYTYYDINKDGIDELIIGEIAEGGWKGVIYDIYTMVNRKPKHVISGFARNRYYVCDDSFVCNEYSSGAAESGLRVYILVENSTELFPQVSFKYDSYQDSENPWFLSYGSNIDDDKWDKVDLKTFKERRKVFERYERFDFTPFSKIKN